MALANKMARIAWALMRDPVSCALMSGLSCGACRWPSWVCADVSGTDLDSVLKCTREWPVLPELFLTTAFSHHACKRFLTDQSSLRPSPTVLRQNITLQLPLRR